MFLCGGADQDCAQVLDRDLPGMVIASLKRRPVKNNHLQGEVLGAAPSLAVTEMEVENLQLCVACFLLYSGGQHQYDLHCAWQIDSHHIEVFDISLSHDCSEVSFIRQVSVAVTPGVGGLIVSVILPMYRKKL